MHDPANTWPGRTAREKPADWPETRRHPPSWIQPQRLFEMADGGIMMTKVTQQTTHLHMTLRKLRLKPQHLRERRHGLLEPALHDQRQTQVISIFMGLRFEREQGSITGFRLSELAQTAMDGRQAESTTEDYLGNDLPSCCPTARASLSRPARNNSSNCLSLTSGAARFISLPTDQSLSAYHPTTVLADPMQRQQKLLPYSTGTCFSLAYRSAWAVSIAAGRRDHTPWQC